MVTIVKQDGHNNMKRVEYMGLSTDKKPIDTVNGSLFHEMNTNIDFLFDEENKKWLVQN